MDNNWVRKYIVSLFFCVFCLSLYGQNIKKHYISKAQEKGSIYHFLSVSLFKDTDGKKLSYDLTYTSWNDTIMMNFTYVKPEPLLIDSIKYVSGNIRIEGRVDKLYVEPTSKKWIHRYSLRSKADEFFRIYNANATPEIIIFSNGKNYSYHVEKSDWRKYVPIGQKIFKMIRL